MPRLRTRALQLSVEGLLKLLGGTPAERERFWEILKGITTPAEFELANQQVQILAGLVNQVKASSANLKETAGMMQGKR